MYKVTWYSCGNTVDEDFDTLEEAGKFARKLVAGSNSDREVEIWENVSECEWLAEPKGTR